MSAATFQGIERLGAVIGSISFCSDFQKARISSGNKKVKPLPMPPITIMNRSSVGIINDESVEMMVVVAKTDR